MTELRTPSDLTQGGSKEGPTSPSSQLDDGEGGTAFQMSEIGVYSMRGQLYTWHIWRTQRVVPPSPSSS